MLEIPRLKANYIITIVIICFHLIRLLKLYIYRKPCTVDFHSPQDNRNPSLLRISETSQTLAGSHPQIHCPKKKLISGPTPTLFQKKLPPTLAPPHKGHPPHSCICVPTHRYTREPRRAIRKRRDHPKKLRRRRRRRVALPSSLAAWQPPWLMVVLHPAADFISLSFSFPPSLTPDGYIGAASLTKGRPPDDPIARASLTARACMCVYVRAAWKGWLSPVYTLIALDLENAFRRFVRGGGWIGSLVICGYLSSFKLRVNLGEWWTAVLCFEFLVNVYNLDGYICALCNV